MCSSQFTGPIPSITSPLRYSLKNRLFPGPKLKNMGWSPESLVRASRVQDWLLSSTSGFPCPGMTPSGGPLTRPAGRARMSSTGQVGCHWNAEAWPPADPSFGYTLRWKSSTSGCHLRCHSWMTPADEEAFPSGVCRPYLGNNSGPGCAYEDGWRWQVLRDSARSLSY